jgi:type IX secretion system PorP/SprF family membrane protein
MMGNVRLIISSMLLALAGTACAQHSPVTSQYLFNGLLINPAYAGSRDALAVNLTWRKQWLNMEGAPETQVLSIHTPLKRKRVGLGLLVTNDRIGVSRETGVFTNYAYRIPFRKGKLQFGLGAGISMLQANWTALAIQDRSDMQFASDTRMTVRPNFSGGVFYYKKLFYVGASLPFFLSRRFDAEKNTWVVTSDRSQYQPMLTGGYVFQLNKDLKLKPTTLVRYHLASGLQADLSTNIIIKDRIWAGVSYRSNDAVVGMFEVLPTPQWRLGYAYDLGISDITPYHSGTHELMLQYEFGYRVRVRDPRYF